MDVRKEQFYRIIDDLIDEGADVIKEVRRSGGGLRKRAQRLFPPKDGKSSTEIALESYGFSFDRTTPSVSELEDCWKITDSYEVVVDERMFSEILSIYNISPRELRVLCQEVKKDVIFDCLSSFVSETSPEQLSYSFIKEEFPHIRSYIINYFDKFQDFRDAFGIDYRLIFYNNPGKRWIYIYNGHEFERLLEKHLFGTRFAQVEYKDCRPDFIINGKWIDAKLSKSTALNRFDDTIDKYMKHTDGLTIIYAIDDEADCSEIDNVEFKHISDYYEVMRREAVTEFEDFIERVSAVKGGGVRK